MAGPRNKRKRVEAPTDVALDRGRGAIGTEPAKVPRTDDNARSVEKLGLSNDSDAKLLSLQPRQSESIGGDDHAELDAPTLSLVDQNLREGVDNTTGMVQTMPIADKSMSPSAEAPDTVTEFKKISIRELLEHRKLLLVRLRQGKAAAQKRLRCVLECQPSKAQETDAQEIAAFNETARVATAVARKQARNEVAAPPEQKRNGLRKGSTVGKKMNAAISSLVAGSSTADPEPCIASDQPQLVKEPVTLSMPQIISSLALPNQFSTDTDDRNATTKTSKIPAVSNSLLNGSTGVAKSVKLPSRLASSAASANRSGGICPETTNLRDEKKLLEGKLTLLYSRRYQRMRDVLRQEQNSSDLFSLSPAPSHAAKEVSPSKIWLAAATRGPGDAARLPCRRLTHWDYLLDEAKWLATDFIEERKWKRAAAKGLSETVIGRSGSARRRLNGRRLAKSEELDINRRRIDLSGLSQSVSTISTAQLSVNTSSVYAEVGDLDRGIAQGVAKLLSGMVLKLSSKMRRTSAIADGDGYCDMIINAVPLDSLETLPVSMNTSYNDSSNTAVLSETPDRALADRNTIFDRFSWQVDEVFVDKSKSHGGKGDHNSPLLSIYLTPAQLSAIAAIEDQWQRSKCGIQLGGQPSSGKTVLISSLLYKNRSSGPQLVVCNPSSMIKWMHEVGRLDDVSLHLVEHNSELQTLDEMAIRCYRAKDVLVCGFKHLSILSRKTLSNFCSVVVDLRFPQGFGAARSMNEVSNANGLQPPCELVSTSWWAHLGLVSSNLNRVIIDGPVPCATYTFVYPESKNRKSVELLGLRVIFLLGCSEFPLSGYSLGKSVLAWARHRIKNAKNVEGNLSKLTRVWELFTDILDKLSYRIHDSSSKVSGWTLRLCKLPHSQSLAYANGCHKFRPILSTSMKSIMNDVTRRSDAIAPVSEALLELRRVCFHADCFEACAKIKDEALHYVLESRMVAAASPSQPNIKLAIQILGGSAKLMELIMILASDCGVEVPSWSLFGNASRIVADRRNIVTARKVAILATLPEAQILTSVLLTVLGVNHTLLLPSASGDNDDVETGAGNYNQTFQAVLSDFNSERSDLVSNQTTLHDVVISSPEIVAGDHGGLGVELADVVVLVDDDWSGRGNLLLDSLRARCAARRGESSTTGPCHFIRLIASGTCEASFIAGDDVEEVKGLEPLSVYPSWPVDAAGLFVPPHDPSIAVHRNGGASRFACKKNYPEHCFPAVNILKLRNEDLANVLGTRKPVHQLLSSMPMLFLPDAEEPMSSLVVEAAIATSLLQHEKRAARWLSCSAGNRDLAASIRKYQPCQSLALAARKLAYRNMVHLPSSVYLSSWEDVVGQETDDSGAVSLMLPHAVPNADLTAQAMPSAVPVECSTTKSRGSFEIDSLLFYPDSGSRNNDARSFSDPATGRRVNAYSSAFSRNVSNNTQLFGSAGFEALLYRPPLFPGVLECAEQAQIDVQCIRFRKRSIEDDMPAGEKRSCLERDNTKNHVVTEDQATHGDAASVLFDFADDYGLAGIGAVPLPRDSALLTGWAKTELPNILSVQDSAVWLPRLPPCDIEEEQAELVRRLDASVLSKMLLFVSRKRCRDGSGYTMLQNGGSTPGGAHWAAAGGSFQSINTSFQDMHGKRIKNKPHSVKGAGTSAFSRLTPTNPIVAMPSAGQLAPASSTSRAVDSQGRTLMPTRKDGRVRSLFEAPMYQAASIRVRNRIAERIERLCWNSPTAFDAGPGLPLVVKQHFSASVHHHQYAVDPALWTSIVKRLKTRDCATGDESIAVAMAQRIALRRSSNGPCRVDFGPFRCGFLSQPSGMSAVPPPRFRLGISLPMGVKVHASKDLPFTTWSARENELLRRSVARFGMNWILISRVVSGFETEFSQPMSAGSKAPRACREHWRFIIRSQPELAKEMREVPGESFDASTRRITVAAAHSALRETVSSGIEFLIPAPDKSERPPSPAYETTDISAKPVEETVTPKPKRSFSLLNAAKARKHVLSESLPGVTGDSAASLPVHISHAQAIQAAITASATYSSSGRTEMWPLQLLETIGRQRSAQTTTTPPPSTPVTAATSKIQPTSSSRSQTKQTTTTSSRAAPSSSPAVASQPRPAAKATTSSKSPPPTKAAPVISASFNPPVSKKTAPTTSSTAPPILSTTTPVKNTSPPPDKSVTAHPVKNTPLDKPN